MLPGATGFQDFQAPAIDRKDIQTLPGWSQPGTDLNLDTQLGYWEGKGEHQGTRTYI